MLSAGLMAAQFRATLIGTSVRVLVGLGVPMFVGIYLDGRNDSQPIYSVIGIIIGLLLTFVAVWLLVEENQRGQL